uniref:Dolichyl-diphosphooligosaccharide--protein glycotransferase n=1 Tax=Parascaris equorum TaxID=6256 RepID=A0A914RM53_PAREQ
MAGSSSDVTGKGFTNSVGITSLLTFIILVLAWLVGFASRLFAIVRFKSIIHEFDPWFCSYYNEYEISYILLQSRILSMQEPALFESHWLPLEANTYRK